MGAGDLRLVGIDERPVAHDVGSLDDEAIHAMRRREHEACNPIVRTAELEAVRPPDSEIGPLAGLEGTDVVPSEHPRAAASP